MLGIFPIGPTRLRIFPQPVRRCALAASLTALLAPAALSAATPVIDQLGATPPSVAPGGTVTITVAAHDPDCTTGTCTDTSGCGLYIRADLTSWAANGGTFLAKNNGVSASPYSASADWQAPAVEATYTISVTLSDSGSFLCGGRQTVLGTIDVQVTTLTGAPPVVDSLTAEPSQILSDGSSALTCAATDADDDPVVYSWSSDGGELTPGTGGGATFASSELGLFTVTCTATDPVGLTGSDSIQISVTGALADGSVGAGLTTPLRLAMADSGELWVVDRGAGRLAAVDLGTGNTIYRLPYAGATSVAVDWAGRLLVGGRDGARVIDDLGAPLFDLQGDAALGPVADVAVDHASRRYASLHPSLGRVAVYDETGGLLLAFGSTGDGAGQMRGPRGLAFGPDGSIAVADTGHGLVHVFTAAGALVRSFGGQGGGAGKFVRLDDVEVGETGLIYASDAFQDWVRIFDSDGVARDTVGTYGEEPGELETAAGLAISAQHARLLVASSSGSRVELYRTSDSGAPFPSGASPAVTPSGLSFASMAVGAESSAQQVTLSNVGGSRLGIAKISTGSDFTQTNDCGPVLEVGGSCSLAVSFRPTAAGPRSGSLLIETSGEPLRVGVALAGDGLAAAPQVQLLPATLLFAPQAVGTESDPQSVQLTNVGSMPLTLAGISTGGEFTWSSVCPSQLPAGAGCPIEVRYAPLTVADPALGTLSVSNDAPGSPHSVALSASSTPAVPTISIGDWEGEEGAAGESTTASFTVTLSRSTSVPVTVSWSTADVSAVAGADYEAGTGEATIEAGETEVAIEVTVLGDDLLEPDTEWFRVLLGDATGAEIADGTGEGTILDDELCLSENLLVNPSAEARPEPDGALPGWTAFVGPLWQRRGAPPEPVDGNYSFYSGTSAYGELVQDVDVSAFAGPIDAGNQRFRFAASVRTLYEVTPTARIVLEYRDLDNLAPLEVADSGPIGSPAAWTLLEDERTAPAGTGWIRVRLINLEPGVAWFDALTLRSLRAAAVVVDDVQVDEGDSGFRQALFPVRLACPYAEPVALDYATRDGSALEGEDYLAAVGRLELGVGETTGSVAVDVVGDRDDEAHETFGLDLELDPGSSAVLVDGSAEGRIRNDDFCGYDPADWLRHLEEWPVDRLELGGVEYGRDALIELLGYHGSNVPHRLAKELAATKLNLERGTKTDILPVVEKADRFLAARPPGSDLGFRLERLAKELESQLADYNGRGCIP